MAVLRDIAKNLGIIPRLLANRDEKQSNELARLMGENEALREQMSGAQGGAPTGMKKGGKVKKMAAGGLGMGRGPMGKPMGGPVGRPVQATPFDPKTMVGTLGGYQPTKSDLKTFEKDYYGGMSPRGATAVRGRSLAKKPFFLGKKMAAGGSVSKRADGCAVKGKTRGKMI